MLPITILTLALLLSSCATLNPLAPYSAGADGLVMLENLCEDPLEDAQTLTPLEATADMLALPLTMGVYVVRLATYSTVGLGMVLAGREPRTVVDQINWVLPMPWVGPNPDRVAYHPGMVKEEGCLRAALTGENDAQTQ
jgi:hypothetical protein